MKKSPAEDKQGQSVEDIFRNGFADAEGAPPSRIWENVNLELENQNLHRYRQQAKWYRSIAAVFLLLLVSAGIILWQQEPMGGQQENRLATSKDNESKVAPIGSASINSVPEVGLKKSAVPEQLASVSDTFAEKSPQNGEASVSAVSEEKAVILPKNKKAPVEIVAQQRSVGIPNSTETVSENTVAEEAPVLVKEALTGKTIFSQSGGNGQFSRSMVNSLASSKILPTTVDSLIMAPKRSILVQKEAENPAVAQTATAAKGNEAEETGVYKWSVTIAYSPQYAYTPVKLGGNSAVSAAADFAQPQVYQQYQQAVEEYNQSYTPTYSYSALVGASYKINDKWQLETGVLYTQNEATTTQSYLVYQGNHLAAYSPVNLNSAGSPGKSTPLVTNAFSDRSSTQAVYVVRTNQFNIKYKYQQVGLPLRLAYRLNLNKVYALFSGGVNMNLLVQNAIVPETNQVETVIFGFNDKDSPFRTLQWATTTSIGVGYDVTKKMSILIAPEFTYSLTPMVREQQQQANTYQLGLSIGGRWRLTK